MKANRVIIIVLCLLVLVLGYLAFSGRQEPAGGQATELWHTNTVEVWRTNAVERWRTNLVEVPLTNTVLEPVTKEVPAKLSDVERRAALVGYKFLNAATFTTGSDTLYKAGPTAVEVSLRPDARGALPEDAGGLKQRIEAILTSRNIPVADKSAAHLSLEASPVWTSDEPRVALVMLRLELTEKAGLERQGDLIGCNAVVWSSTSSKLVRTARFNEEVQTAVEQQVEKFCQDYLKAKGSEKTLGARLPAIPSDFLSGAK